MKLNVCNISVIIAICIYKLQYFLNVQISVQIINYINVSFITKIDKQTNFWLTFCAVKRVWYTPYGTT